MDVFPGIHREQEKGTGAAKCQGTLEIAGSAAKRLSDDTAGEQEWWQQIAELGSPIAEALDKDRIKMTWFWRDPQGSEAHSATRRVYVDINGVTDHHSTSPASMQRLPDTDVWHWSTTVEHDWRGSYSLIPISDSHLPPVFSTDDGERKRQQRAWWISLFPLAIADPLNLYPANFTRYSYPHCVAQAPSAPDQSVWLAADKAFKSQRCQHFVWESSQLGNRRDIWLYASGEAEDDARRPLVILLDGQNWIDGYPLLPVLESATTNGTLPAACYLFIDVIDSAHREKELPCNAEFWQAIQHELLPLAKQRMAFSDDGERTIVAGQSYGGLAAMYAGLHWPERFGRVLSQSGSFWWPNLQLMTHFEQRHRLEAGWLTQQLQRSDVAPASLSIFMEAGNRESDIEFVNQQLYQALKAAGHRVSYRVFSGGHDALCWRGGLLDGLHQLLSDMDS
ncbi:enterochelin esterase [Rouxiella sp. Mn2063]|uniref:enterochelin esterase n=1 Tax=Rouxiella sp. Mn2063 TaxID=3395262 RepID=UPI003BEBBA71